MQRLKLQLSLYYQPSNLDDNDDGAPGPDELDLHSGYRRPKLVSNHKTVTEKYLDYVNARLLIVRISAIAKYQEIWG